LAEECQLMNIEQVIVEHARFTQRTVSFISDLVYYVHMGLDYFTPMPNSSVARASNLQILSGATR